MGNTLLESSKGPSGTYSRLNGPSQSCACRAPICAHEGQWGNEDHMCLKKAHPLPSTRTETMELMVTWRGDLLSQVSTIRKQYEGWSNTKRKHAFFSKGGNAFYAFICYWIIVIVLCYRCTIRDPQILTVILLYSYYKILAIFLALYNISL